MSTSAVKEVPQEKMVRIKFTESESGWAEDLGEGKFRLANIPVFDSIGLCIDDVVTVKKFDGWDLVDKVVKKVFAGKACLYYDKIPQFRKLIKALSKLGCKCEGLISPRGAAGPGIMIAVYPKGVNPKKIAEKMGITQKGRSAKKA